MASLVYEREIGIASTGNTAPSHLPFALPLSCFYFLPPHFPFPLSPAYLSPYPRLSFPLPPPISPSNFPFPVPFPIPPNHPIFPFLFPPPIFPLTPAYLSPYPLLFPLPTSPSPSLFPFLQITPFSSFHPTHKITLTKRLVLSLLLTRIASLTRCFITKVYQVRKWRGSP